jgi:hypothetical protein
VEADPRGDAEIPVTVRLTENVAYNGPRPFEGILTVNPRLFLARTIVCPTGSAEIVSQDIVNGVRQIRFRCTGNYPRNGVLAVLTGPAGLAETDVSPLVFDASAPAFGQSVSTQYGPGQLRILNPDPDRRILHPSSPAITMVAPQPASDRVRISIAAPKATAAMLTITDQHGVVISADAVDLMEGESMIPLETSTLPSGVFMLTLSSGTVQTTTRLVIVR